MIRIADLAINVDTTTGQTPSLVVSPNAPVSQILAHMDQNGYDSVGVENDGQTKILSRKDMLNGMLYQLETAQQSLDDLRQTIDANADKQLELIRHGVNAVTDHHADKLNAVIDTVSDGLMIFDESGNMEKINQTAREILSIGCDNSADLDQILNKVWLREVLSDDQISEKLSGELRVKSNAGSILLVNWCRMLDDNGSFTGTIVAVKDATENILAEQAKANFISSISHELRTPITSIQNSVSNLLAGVAGKQNTKTKSYLEVMQDDCHRYAVLVNDMVDMAKIDTSSMPLRKEVINITDLIKTSVQSFKESAKKQGIQLTNQSKSHVSAIYADKARVSQVMWNILSNAIKYTNDAGKISVDCTEDENNIVITVSDNGIGIDSEMHRKIFTKFFQIDRQVGAGYKGSGLGLAVSDGVIALHGGRIWVESNGKGSGTGSTFIVTLPKMDQHKILIKQMTDLVGKGRRTRDNFTLLMLSFTARSDEIDSQKNAQAVNGILANRNEFRLGNGDIVIQTSDSEIFFVIVDTNNSKADSVCRRVEKNVSKQMRKSFGDTNIVPMVGIASYPGDSCDVSQLEAIAIKGLRPVS